MFIHNFKYSLKVLFRNKSLIFWTFIFPILLGTFFRMAFNDIENNEAFHAFDIAVVDSPDYENNTIFKEAISEASKDGDNKLFNVKMVNREDASKLLENKKIKIFVDYGLKLRYNAILQGYILKGGFSLC